MGPILGVVELGDDRFTRCLFCLFVCLFCFVLFCFVLFCLFVCLFWSDKFTYVSPLPNKAAKRFRSSMKDRIRWTGVSDPPRDSVNLWRLVGKKMSKGWRNLWMLNFSIPLLGAKRVEVWLVFFPYPKHHHSPLKLGWVSWLPPGVPA